MERREKSQISSLSCARQQHMPGLFTHIAMTSVSKYTEMISCPGSH